MEEKIAKARAPATVANLGPGFDLLGVAISRPWDTVIARWNDQKKIIIDSIQGDGGRLPKDPRKNVVGIVADALRKSKGIRRGITLTLKKGIPVASGLGGSAASSVAAAVAVNQLMDKPYSKEELIPFALKGERAASGDIHYDNLLPSLFGGMILITSSSPLSFIPVPIAGDLSLVVLHPALQIETKMARRLIPKKIPGATALKQSAALANLLLAIRKNHFEEKKNWCVDFIAEPKRAPLIPGFRQIQKAALNSGALGSSISGSGPSLFALCRNTKAGRIGRAMQSVWKQKKIPSTLYETTINKTGARAIK